MLFDDDWEFFHFLTLLVETGNELLQLSLMLDISTRSFAVRLLLLRRAEAFIVRVLLVLVLRFTLNVQQLHSLLPLSLWTLLHVGSPWLLKKMEFEKGLDKIKINVRFEFILCELLTTVQR